MKEKARQETPNKNIDEQIAIECFDVVPFMKQKQRRNNRKERDKNKEPKESTKRQEGRKNENNKRQTEKRY